MKLLRIKKLCNATYAGSKPMINHILPLCILERLASHREKGLVSQDQTNTFVRLADETAR